MPDTTTTDAANGQDVRALWSTILGAVIGDGVTIDVLNGNRIGGVLVDVVIAGGVPFAIKVQTSAEIAATLIPWNAVAGFTPRVAVA